MHELVFIITLRQDCFQYCTNGDDEGTKVARGPRVSITLHTNLLEGFFIKITKMVKFLIVYAPKLDLLLRNIFRPRRDTTVICVAVIKTNYLSALLSAQNVLKREQI